MSQNLFSFRYRIPHSLCRTIKSTFKVSRSQSTIVARTNGSNCSHSTTPICPTEQLIYRTYSSQINRKQAMRFIQFRRRIDPKIRLGLVSDDGVQYADLSAQTSYPRDMIQFLQSQPDICELQGKVNCLKWKCVDDDLQLLPPVLQPEKIVCIGLNYADHCTEQNKPLPKEPIFFSKFASSLVGPTDNVVHPGITDSLDWEVELAVIIGKEARHVQRENAFDYIFGYTVAQDISARDWQKQRNGGQFLIGKSMDTFCPLGPSIVHKSLIKDPHNLSLTCSINGVEKQSGKTDQLIFRIDEIICRLSQCMTLKPGDVILTGTPSGVGMHRNPPEYLKPGDVISSEIENIGKLQNKVVKE